MDICLGGHLAFRAALNPDVLAAACFYATDIDTSTLGKGDDSLKRAGDIKGELLTVWGRQDPLLDVYSRCGLHTRAVTNS
jgi:carboxymethylenebutenolidase